MKENYNQFSPQKAQKFMKQFLFLKYDLLGTGPEEVNAILDNHRSKELFQF